MGWGETSKSPNVRKGCWTSYSTGSQASKSIVIQQRSRGLLSRSSPRCIHASVLFAG